MRKINLPWSKLFLFFWGITLAATFVMQWLGLDFYTEGRKFSILDLELWYSNAQVTHTLTTLPLTSAIALKYQLYFDFVFMAGVYPGIAVLCMMARQKITASWLRTLLLMIAILQLAAWAFDIIENRFLLKWLANPVIDPAFHTYHIIVTAKWLIALTGVVSFAAGFLMRRWLNRKN